MKTIELMKALEIAKNAMEDKFYEDCIEELENEKCDIFLDYIGEVIYEEMEIEIEKEFDMKLFENLFYEVQEDYLEGKYASRED